MSESLYDSESLGLTVECLYRSYSTSIKTRVCFTLKDFNGKSHLEYFTHKHTHWTREQGPLSFFAK